MSHGGHYASKQGEAILGHLLSLDGGHATAEQISEHFQRAGQRIALATIYRQLDKLVDSGRVRRCVVDGESGACYQCVEPEGQQHFHLKCECCGRLQHLVCEELDGIAGHILASHRFQVNPAKTVFYGRCERCISLL